MMNSPSCQLKLFNTLIFLPIRQPTARTLIRMSVVLTPMTRGRRSSFWLGIDVDMDMADDRIVCQELYGEERDSSATCSILQAPC